MSATTTRLVSAAPPSPTAERSTPRTLRQRIGPVIPSAVAAVLGVLPHILHHAGPLAGAALFAGIGGSLLFGAIGLIAATPFLLRVHRRCGNWRLPAALLALFAVVFAVSTFVIGPAITGADNGNGKPASTQTAPGAPANDRHASHH